MFIVFSDVLVVFAAYKNDKGSSSYHFSIVKVLCLSGSFSGSRDKTADVFLILLVNIGLYGAPFGKLTFKIGLFYCY
jgi:hypothetical protein